MIKLALKLRARFSARPPRLATVLDTSMVMADDRVLPISIRNISEKGFMAATSEEVEVGAWIGVEIPTLGIVRANVRWANSGRIGVQFRTPLDLDHLRRAASAEGGTLFRLARPK